jgi:hypothetical protein
VALIDKEILKITSMIVWKKATQKILNQLSPLKFLKSLAVEKARMVNKKEKEIQTIMKMVAKVLILMSILITITLFIIISL